MPIEFDEDGLALNVKPQDFLDAGIRLNMGGAMEGMDDEWARVGYPPPPSPEEMEKAVHEQGNLEKTIVWYLEGAGGQIDWASPGSLDQCIEVAKKHFDPADAEAFALRLYQIIHS